MSRINKRGGICAYLVRTWRRAPAEIAAGTAWDDGELQEIESDRNLSKAQCSGSLTRRAQRGMGDGIESGEAMSKSRMAQVLRPTGALVNFRRRASDATGGQHHWSWLSLLGDSDAFACVVDDDGGGSEQGFACR